MLQNLSEDMHTLTIFSIDRQFCQRCQSGQQLSGLLNVAHLNVGVPT